MKRYEIPDGTEVAGFYVRTVRTGPLVFVSGTTSLDAKGRVVGRDAAAQTHASMRKIGKALKSAGASFKDVTRVTIYCTDIRDMKPISEAFARYFSKTRVASTLVAVSALAVPGLLVEIEATAVLADGT